MTGASLVENEVKIGKAGFRKISFTIPPQIYEQLMEESTRRRLAGEPNRLLSALLREAVEQYLMRLDR
jgi:hypothetical protein